jgi:hypothetical protein
VRIAGYGTALLGWHCPRRFVPGYDRLPGRFRNRLKLGICQIGAITSDGRTSLCIVKAIEVTEENAIWIIFVAEVCQSFPVFG